MAWVERKDDHLEECKDLLAGPPEESFLKTQFDRFSQTPSRACCTYTVHWISLLVWISYLPTYIGRQVPESLGIG